MTPDMTWADPMDDMILMANELAFRTALKTSEMHGHELMDALVHGAKDNMTSEQSYIISPNLTTTSRTLEQNVTMSSSKVIVVYATDRGWLAGG